MKHRVSGNTTVEYKKSCHKWESVTQVDGMTIRYTSPELIDVIVRLNNRDEVSIDGLEWTRQGGIEQVLVVLTGEED